MNVNKTVLTRVLVLLVIAATFASPLGVAKTSQAAPEQISASVVGLNSEIVSVEKKISIELTESQYQQNQKAKIAKKSVVSPQLVVSATKEPEPSIEEKRVWVQKAAAAHFIDWKLLEAVWQIESGKRWKTSVTSYAGAQGPCQFMPGTWRGYQQDGNGDGVKDVTDARDCLFAAAKLLAANGAASGNNVNALYHYNHSMAYVNKVLSIAAGI